jgi:hypothetical protein
VTRKCDAAVAVVGSNQLVLETQKVRSRDRPTSTAALRR